MQQQRCKVIDLLETMEIPENGDLGIRASKPEKCWDQ